MGKVQKNRKKAKELLSTLPVPHYIVIHHTAIGGRDVQAQAVENGHRDKYRKSPYTGSSIAYHFLIGRDGTVKRNRSIQERTGHTLNNSINKTSLGIALAGNFNDEHPTAKQVAAMRSLIEDLQSRYDIPVEHVIPHRHASGTDCPGAHLAALLTSTKLALK